MSGCEEALIKQMEENLRMANTILFKRGRSILTGMEVSTPQFNALLALQQFGPLTMGELCKQLFTACSTATDLADRMESAGFVARTRDSKDRRVVRMHLLPKGEEIVQAVIAERRLFLQSVLDQCEEAEQQALVAALQTLANRMEKFSSEYNIEK